jgi:hypothetical protein
MVIELLQFTQMNISFAENYMQQESQNLIKKDTK